MTAILLLVIGVAMIVAVAGRRNSAIGLFGVGVLVSILLLRYHMTDPLALAF